MSRINRLIEALSLISKKDIFSKIKVLTEGENALLLTIYKSKNGYLSPKEITLKMMVTKGRVSNLINVLKEKGYIDIAISNIYRRKLDVFLTINGKNYIESLVFEIESLLNEVSIKLGDEKTESIIDSLLLFNNVMEG